MSANLPVATRAALPEIVRDRSTLRYTRAEREFSSFMQMKLYRLLRGEDNELLLLRRYCGFGASTAYLVPRAAASSELRPDTAEDIVQGVMRMLSPAAPGGPVSQRLRGEQLVEVQAFPTQYPHIIIERTDLFETATMNRVYAEWKAVRVQNQRRTTLINRALDFSLLAVEFAKFASLV